MGKRNSLKRTAQAQPRPEGTLALPFFIFSALMLVIVTVYVAWLMPSNNADVQAWTLGRQGLKNCIDAQRMVESSQPARFTRWLAQPRGGMIGRGVWYFEGLGGVDSFGTEVSTPWKIVFIPGAPHPLFLAVGAREEGNWAMALRTAGLDPNKP